MAVSPRPKRASYAPVMTIVSVRKRPSRTCLQRCRSGCTLRALAMLLVVSTFVGAVFVIEWQLRLTLASELQQAQVDVFSWCGDWTPFGNLGNESYDPTYTEAVDLAIPSCPQSKVGTNYVGKPNQLYCSPDLTAFNRSAATLALDMRFLNTTGRPEYSVISQSRSQAELLLETAPMLCRHTVGAWEAIFVLDAALDDSLQVLHQVLTSPVCLQSSLVRARVYVQPLPGALETSSLNLALTAARPSHFYAHAPANVLIQERGWNRDMARVLLEYHDVFSVSGQCGSSMVKKPVNTAEYAVGRCASESQNDFDHEAEPRDTESTAYVTETNTRGLILWRADALRDLGFLNEANYFEHDNDELNRRAFHLRGWYVAYKYAHSRIMDDEAVVENLGTEDESWLGRHVWKYFRRRSDPERYPPAVHLSEEAQHSLSNYRRFRSKQAKADCLDDEPSDYFHPFHDHAEKRRLETAFDYTNPLPPLPAMI